MRKRGVKGPILTPSLRVKNQWESTGATWVFDRKDSGEVGRHWFAMPKLIIDVGRQFGQSPAGLNASEDGGNSPSTSPALTDFALPSTRSLSFRSNRPAEAMSRSLRPEKGPSVFPPTRV